MLPRWLSGQFDVRNKLNYLYENNSFLIDALFETQQVISLKQYIDTDLK